MPGTSTNPLEKQSFRTRHWIIGAIIVLSVAILYFYALGGVPFFDPDEPVYGQVAREMAFSGPAGWLSPHLFGALWFDKPPLFYWLSSLSSLMLGSGELATRFPSAVLALGLVVCVFLLASYDYGKRAGVFSALVITTCLQQIVLARAAVTDMTLAFCLAGALYAFRRWLDAERWSAYGWAILCGAMAGFGTLAKGPVALLLLTITFVIFLLWSKRLARLKQFDALLAVLATLAVGLPWFLAMYHLHRTEFVQGFLLANNLTRFTTPEHDTTQHWYSVFLNVPILFVFLFPWSSFLPQAFLRRPWKDNAGARLAMTWFIVVFLFFSLSKTILVTYIFPCYIAAAVLIGALWQQASSQNITGRRSIQRGLLAGTIFAGLLLLFLLYYSRKEFPSLVASATLLGVVLLSFSAIAMILACRLPGERIGQAALILAGGMVCFSLVLVTTILPRAATDKSYRGLISRLPVVQHGHLYGLDLPMNQFPGIYYYAGLRHGYVAEPIGPRFVTLANKAESKMQGDPVEHRELIEELLLEREPVFIISRNSREYQSCLTMPNSYLWERAGKYAVIANAAAYSLKGQREP